MESARRSTAVALVCLVALLISSGCSQMAQSEIKALETRELNLAYNDAYKAAANGLFSLGFTINHSDRESGIVSGVRNDPNTGKKIANTLLFGVLGLAATSSREESVSFMLSPLEDHLTQLRMKVLVNGKPVVDRKVMTMIWQRIEREAMLESGPADHPETETARSATISDRDHQPQPTAPDKEQTGSRASAATGRL